MAIGSAAGDAFGTGIATLSSSNNTFAEKMGMWMTNNTSVSGHNHQYLEPIYITFDIENNTNAAIRDMRFIASEHSFMTNVITQMWANYRINNVEIIFNQITGYRTQTGSDDREIPNNVCGTIQPSHSI